MKTRKNESDLVFKKPFCSYRKRMTVVHNRYNFYRLIVKGSPEVIIPLVSTYIDANNVI